MKNTIIHAGKRKVCRIFDAGDTVGDRYTIAFKGFRDSARETMVYPYLAASPNPYSPTGIGQHGESTMFLKGRELGKRVTFESLPEPVQRFILGSI